MHSPRGGHRRLFAVLNPFHMEEGLCLTAASAIPIEESALLRLLHVGQALPSTMERRCHFYEVLSDLHRRDEYISMALFWVAVAYQSDINWSLPAVKSSLYSSRLHWLCSSSELRCSDSYQMVLLRLEVWQKTYVSRQSREQAPAREHAYLKASGSPAFLDMPSSNLRFRDSSSSITLCSCPMH